MLTFDLWMYALGVAVVGALFWRSRGQRRRHKRFGLDLTDDLEVAAHLALHLAKQRSHGRVSALHLAWALLQDEAAAALLARLEFDITALEAALDQRLDGIPPSRTARLSSNLTLEAEASLRSAAETAPGEQDRSARANRCDCAAALAYLLCGPTADSPKQEDKRQLLAAVNRAEVDADALVYAIAHGELERPLEAPATTDSSERQRVVMHNDDFTPMMLVVELLMRELALDQTQATELMVRVHREGSAECGSWPANEAHRIAQAIITGARAAHYPLRVMLR